MATTEQPAGDHTSVVISDPKPCDFCKAEGATVEATVDGKTRRGPWAYMCDNHFQVNGVGLGLGRGQRLIVKSDDE